MNSRQRKRDIIDQIANRIHNRHKSVLSFDKVKEFTQHALKDKATIDGTELTRIEVKVRSALNAAKKAEPKPNRITPNQIQQSQVNEKEDENNYFSPEVRRSSV